MQITLPVYLYDVVTTSDPARVVVTCRRPDDATALAVRLNQTALDGGETFTAAPPRVAAVEMAVDPGSSVLHRRISAVRRLTRPRILWPPALTNLISSMGT